MFYVYKWFIKDTNEVFYIGKGTRDRVKKLYHRNQIFLEYYNNYDCAYEIIKYFDDENEAYAYEKELISYYWSLGQSKANIDAGGCGGHHFVMTDKMRAYLSKYSKMKEPEHRERMHKNNPMYNPATAELVAKKNRKSVIIGDKEYSCINEAAKELNCPYETIRAWCKRGYNSNRELCYYKNEQPLTQVPLMKNEEGVLIDGKYFPSIKRAATFLGKKSSSRLATALREHKKTYCGHIIEYANQQPSQENNQ